MRKIIGFIGANLFLFGIATVSAGVGAALFRLAQLAGADDELMHWLALPIAVVAVVAGYYAGKHAHRLLAKVL